MSSQFSSDFALYWTPGAGGNFLAGMLFPERSNSQLSNEYKTDPEFWASMDAHHQSFTSITDVIQNNKHKHYPMMGFHELPVQLIESNSLAPYIRKKCFFIIDCDPQDVKFCLALNFAKKWVYAGLKDRHYAFETIKNIATTWDWDESSLEKNYKWWKILFDESQGLEHDILGHHLEQYMSGWRKGTNNVEEFQFPVTTGHLLYVSYCVRQRISKPTPENFIKFIKNEFENHQDIEKQRTDNVPINVDECQLEIIRMPYWEIFFQLSFPNSFIKHVKNYNIESVRSYSLKNLEIVENFVKNLYASRQFQNYLNKARNLLTNTI